MPISHVVGGPLHLTVCGFASASGTVSLQGRAKPGGSFPLTDPPGSVTLTDGAFGPYTSPIDPLTGAWSIPSIKVMPGVGTLYTLDATHSLYLGNRTTHTFMPLEAYAAPATKLQGWRCRQ